MLLTCLEIFAARIIDVSLGTIRTVFFVKGKTIEPFIIAFFEVLIWYAVAREALNSSGNAILIAISYSLGYATGTYIGAKLSKKFIKGISGVQVIVKDKSEKLLNHLRRKGYVVSVIELKKTYEGDNREMIYVQVNNKNLNDLTKTIKKYDEEAFIAVNETKYVQNGFIK